MQCETKTQHLDSKTATELEQHISACLSQLYKCSYFLRPKDPVLYFVI